MSGQILDFFFFYTFFPNPEISVKFIVLKKKIENQSFIGWCLLLSCQKVHYVGVSKSTVSVHHNITNQSLLRVKLIRDVVHVLQRLNQRGTEIYTINNSLLSSSCEPEFCTPHFLVVRKCAEKKAIQCSSGHLFLRRKIKTKGL